MPAGRSRGIVSRVFRARLRSAASWVWIGAHGLALAACTLLADDFVPVSTEAEYGVSGSSDAGLASRGGPVGSGDACTSGAGCCTSDEACDPNERCVAGACVRSCTGAEDINACELALCPGPSCLALEPAACRDGLRSGTEADIDCGGDCRERCAASASCTEDVDCASLRCVSERCAAASCEDGVKNQSEGGLDCGGDCAPCATGAACVNDVDCESRVCNEDSVCSAATCDDGIRNQEETGVDCGATCERCPRASTCTLDEDCASGTCGAAGCEVGVSACCQAASCDDGVANGDSPAASESDIDCGGTDPECARCPDGGRCRRGADCASSVCNAGVCSVAACDDGTRNGVETGTDCGGPPGCARCRDGQRCNLGSDCASNVCAGGACISCDDGVHNAGETDVDCGGAGPACDRCAPGRQCRLDRDCASGACQNGRCCGGNQADCTRCAERLSVGINCDSPGGGIDTAGVDNCSASLQCLIDNPAACATRTTPGCAGNDTSAVCDDNEFGGTAGTGVRRAVQVLQGAGCQL